MTDIVHTLIVAVVTQVCKFVKNHRKVHFYIYFTVCKLHLNKCDFKKFSKKKAKRYVCGFTEYKYIFIIIAKIYNKRNTVTFPKWARRQRVGSPQVGPPPTLAARRLFLDRFTPSVIFQPL